MGYASSELIILSRFLLQPHIAELWYVALFLTQSKYAIRGLTISYRMTGTTTTSFLLAPSSFPTSGTSIVTLELTVLTRCISILLATSMRRGRSRTALLTPRKRDTSRSDSGNVFALEAMLETTCRSSTLRQCSGL